MDLRQTIILACRDAIYQGATWPLQDAVKNLRNSYTDNEIEPILREIGSKCGIKGHLLAMAMVAENTYTTFYKKIEIIFINFIKINEKLFHMYT